MHCLQQGYMMTNTQLVYKVKARVEVVEEIGGSIGADPNLTEDEIATYLKETGVDEDNARTIHTTEAKKRDREHYLAVILLNAAYHNQTGGQLIQELKNDALKGQSTFTGTLAEVLAILNYY